MLLVYIGVGGALGAVARYLLSSWAFGLLGTGFPWGTFLVNMLGSFSLGIVYNLSLATTSVTPELRTMLTVGVLGAFTTFSTLANETLVYLRDGQWLAAATYMLASMVLGVVFLWLGGVLAAFFLPRGEGGEVDE